MEICKNNLSYLTDMTEYDIFCLYGFDRSYQRCSVCLWMSWLFFYSIRPACGPQRCGIVKWWIFEHLNITLGTKRWVSFSRKYYFLIKILFFCEKKKSSFWRDNSLTELKSSPRGMQEIFATSDHLQMLWTLFSEHDFQSSRRMPCSGGECILQSLVLLLMWKTGKNCECKFVCIIQCKAICFLL